jgi:hypothetical protein
MSVVFPAPRPPAYPEHWAVPEATEEAEKSRASPHTVEFGGAERCEGHGQPEHRQNPLKENTFCSFDLLVTAVPSASRGHQYDTVTVHTP